MLADTERGGGERTDHPLMGQGANDDEESGAPGGNEPTADDAPPERADRGHGDGDGPADSSGPGDGDRLDGPGDPGDGDGLDGSGDPDDGDGPDDPGDLGDGDGADGGGADGGGADGGNDGPGDRRDEWCDECGRETAHRVTIEHRTMSRRERNREFSRQPYRVSRCVVCGHTTTERLW